MSYPKAYDPQQGYRHQILTRAGEQEWEHCDYAKDRRERDYLLGEYRLAYGPGFEFKTILFPKKYWADI